MNEKKECSANTNSSQRQEPSFQRWSRALVIGCLLVLVTGLARFTAPAAVADSSAAAVSSVVYLPAAMNGYFDGAIKEGIAGKVLVNGNAVANIPLGLRFFDGVKWSLVTTTQTDSFGNYKFSGVAALAPGQQYYVSYGPNESNPAYVYYWYGPIIESYSGSGSVYGGTFDIADVPLGAPASGTESALPIDFSWSNRQLTGESYRVVVLDQDQDIFWRTFALGEVNQFTLNVLAPDMLFNTQYAWYVEVYLAPDSFGESYGLNDIKFLPPAASTRSATNAPAAVPFQQGSGRGGR